MRIVVIIVIIIFSSCKDKVPKIFLGNWKLDSSTGGPGTKLFPAYESRNIIFKKDGTFEYDWMEGDVGDNYSGNYFIKDSVSNLKILKLVDKRKNIPIYVILEASKDRLKTSSKHRYTIGDSAIVFYMIDVFKKIYNPQN
jgi:hypothetical protein